MRAYKIEGNACSHNEVEGSACDGDSSTPLSAPSALLSLVPPEVAGCPVAPGEVCVSGRGN